MKFIIDKNSLEYLIIPNCRLGYCHQLIQFYPTALHFLIMIVLTSKSHFHLCLGLTLASSRITNKLSGASKITNNLHKLLWIKSSHVIKLILITAPARAWVWVKRVVWVSFMHVWEISYLGWQRKDLQWVACQILLLFQHQLRFESFTI